MKIYALSLEFVVVLIAIAVLVGVALPAYTRSKDKAKEAEVKNGLHTIQLVLERCAVDREGEYPPYLIGGDIRYEPNWDPSLPFDCLGEGFPIIMNRSELSDPLLRAGYIESYPKNPFVDERGKFAMVKLQESVKDPLRNPMIQGVPSEGAIGNRHGCRFGGDGWVMGNVSCDYRYPTFEVTMPDGTIAEYPTGADFEGYPFYDVWRNGNRPELFLPGEFFYKATGPIIAADPDYSETILPVKPVKIDQYVLGGYGSIRRKGEDVLGPEPSIITYSSTKTNDNSNAVYAGNSGKARSFSLDYCISERYVVPTWTRWLNEKDVDGKYPGSPFSLPTNIGLEQVSIGNPNGIPDGIVLMLSSDDAQEANKKKEAKQG